MTSDVMTVSEWARDYCKTLDIPAELKQAIAWSISVEAKKTRRWDDPIAAYPAFLCDVLKLYVDTAAQAETLRLRYCDDLL